MSHDIKLYALSTCIHCKNTKAYLDECGDAYECVFVDKLEGDERKKIIDEVKKLNPAVSFPTMVIDGEVIVGFNKDRINKALGK
ncbi:MULTISPECIES: glutaredoxin family protein [Desulfovibrio]|jgi:glutaredoxin|uniref:glutaredoxin family protein n=1 Tax=Desulfovibrio TaxID=872 RepID=UPI00041116AC|nr:MULTISPECIES: glutaredoxin family protein [Desulfovibrio]MDY0305505.1 glutaredoxin family protein [Desulfovibrionaceae bacterium]HMM39800.1 glutaredoxin family protein [Desulfovibrio sp.]